MGIVRSKIWVYRDEFSFFMAFVNLQTLEFASSARSPRDGPGTPRTPRTPRVPGTPSSDGPGTPRTPRTPRGDEPKQKRPQLIHSIIAWGKSHDLDAELAAKEGSPLAKEEGTPQKGDDTPKSISRSTPKKADTPSRSPRVGKQPSPRIKKDAPRPAFFARSASIVVEQSRSELTRKRTEMSTPAQYIEALLSSNNLTFLKKLENKLATASDEWLMEFMQQDGLTHLMEATSNLDLIEFKKISDLVVQIQLVMCIRAFLNNVVTLELLLDDPELLNQMVQQSSTTKNVMMKVKFFELFAALCLYSERGWKNVCKSFKKAGGLLHHSAYAYLVQLLNQENDTQFRRSGLSLLNAIILGSGDLQQRATVRGQFIQAGALPTLQLIESENFEDPDDPLTCQLSTFQKSWEDDQKDLVWGSCSV
jgi:hypothetical protein